MKSSMSPVAARSRAVLFLLSLAAACSLYGASGADSVRAVAPAGRAPSSLARPPVDFVENRGQWGDTVKFVARRGAATAAFERDRIRIGLGEGRASPLVLSFEGASRGAALSGEARREGRYNFFVGGDRKRWRSGVAAYGQLLYRGLYEGVDVRVRESGELLEYDLLLAPGADLARVVIRADGAAGLEVTPEGGLLVRTADGRALRQTPPRTWEVLPGGETRAVECRFRKLDARRYGFEAGGRDQRLALVVDPGLEWATYLGGEQWEEIYDLAAAGDGTADVIAVGATASPDFSARASSVAGFVARFSSTGALVYKTILGGSDREWVRALAVGAGGEPVVVGESYSPDYPVTPGAYDTTHGFGADGRPGADAFVTRLSAAGDRLVYSTFVGTNDYEQALAVALTPSGAIVVAGETTSAAFPTTEGAFDRTHNCCTPFGAGSFSIQDAWVARLSADGGALEYSTYFGGHGDEIPTGLVVDGRGFVTFTGFTYSPPSGGPFMPTTPGALRTTPASGPFTQDAFLVRMRLDGGGASDLRYSTFLGGDDTDEGYAVALDPTNPQAVFVAGLTHSTAGALRFPTTAGTLRPSSDSVDGFVMKFLFPEAGGGGLAWSTLFGGFLYDEVSDIAVDAAGAVVLAGQTHAFDLPTTQGAYDRSVSISTGVFFFDAYVARLSPDGARVLYASYLGGSHDDWRVKLALTGQDSAAVSGWTQSTDFPASPAGFDPALNSGGPGGPAAPTDGFLARLSLLPDGDGDDTVSAPALLGPAGGASVAVNSLINFDWSDVSDPSGIDGYHIQLNRRADFVCCDDWQEVWTKNSEWVATVRFDGTYYWRVQTADRSGNLSDWSEVRTLNAGTPQPPAAPSLLGPANGARLPPNTAITFSWSAVAGAATYELQIDDSDTFNAPLVESQTGLTQTQYTRSFSSERRHWWRVRARNPGSGVGPWSAVRSFDIKRNAPPPPGPTPTPTPGPVTLSALTLSPGTVTGGGSSQGTVTLSGAAPSGGAAVTLSSSNANVAAVPASVTVPAGATAANFTVTTQPVTASTAVTISATYAGVTRTATLTVNPAQSSDTVAIQVAEYTSDKRELRVEATSTNASAVLRCFVTTTGELIGTLANEGGGRYRGQFTWPTNPQNITVRSSLGGSASRAVTAK